MSDIEWHDVETEGHPQHNCYVWTVNEGAIADPYVCPASWNHISKEYTGFHREVFTGVKAWAIMIYPDLPTRKTKVEWS